MTHLRRSSGLIAFSGLSLVAWAVAFGQDPAPVQGKVDPQGKVEAPPAVLPQPRQADFKIEVKPLPPVAIPDDPPPHEGALFDLPLTVHPPDIIVVEVLEALPGRPITGEKMVRPDGTISLGFYGDLHVRGLTLEQIKVKVILHLRRYLSDDVLGLIVYTPLSGEGEARDIPLPNGGRSPFELIPVPAEAVPDPKKPDAEAKPSANKDARPSARLRREGGPRSMLVRRRRLGQEPATQPAKPAVPPPGEKPNAEPNAPPDMPDGPGIPANAVQATIIEPADSQRVFADISSFNTHVYYVQGDVGVPGRLPWTGGETVLDAINYAGGLVPNAEPTDVHLYRPARGEKPAKDYKVDLEAIRKGEAKANLQMFPGDRLVVGRNPIVAKSIEVDRAVGLINSLSNTIMQYGFSARTLGVINSPPATAGPNSVNVRVNGQNMPVNIGDPTVMTQARREALYGDWVDLLWSLSTREGGPMLDEKAFKEALMKKLAPKPDPDK